jgi:hypothetical protein
MEAYITSIHIKQLKCAVQHYWFQVYTCLFWVASTVFIHNWEIKEKQLEMMMMKDKFSYHNVFATKTLIEQDEQEEEYQDKDDDDDSCCFSEDEESDSDDETIVTTTLAPWTKEKEYETQTLHSFDTGKSESKSNIKRKMSSIKHQVTAWKQKHFHEKSKFSKKKQNILATFRRKTSPDIYI